VGINAVLAMAGAPVRAAALRMTPLAIGTRIRSADSLQEGRSNFYTEILHIKRVFELLGKEKALLFCSMSCWMERIPMTGRLARENCCEGWSRQERSEW